MQQEKKTSGLSPFLFGAAAGVAAVLTAGLMSGYLTTGSLRDVQVSAARLDGEARVCEARVTANRLSRGDSSDIRGFGSSAREARMALARDYSEPMAGSPTADPQSVQACADRLNTAS